MRYTLKYMVYGREQDKQTDIHPHVRNAVPLVWGSHRLAPISIWMATTKAVLHWYYFWLPHQLRYGVSIHNHHWSITQERIRMVARVRGCKSNRNPQSGQNYWTVTKSRTPSTCLATMAYITRSCTVCATIFSNGSNWFQIYGVTRALTLDGCSWLPKK